MPFLIVQLTFITCTPHTFQRAFRGGSFQGTIRGEKHRPSSLASGKGDSPFVAGDAGQVKLTGLRQNKTKETESNGTASKQGKQFKVLGKMGCTMRNVFGLWTAKNQMSLHFCTF